MRRRSELRREERRGDNEDSREAQERRAEIKKERVEGWERTARERGGKREEERRGGEERWRRTPLQPTGGASCFTAASLGKGVAGVQNALRTS